MNIHDEGYFTARRNEDGSDRYLAVKKMKWQVINLYRGHVTEVRGVMVKLLWPTARGIHSYGWCLIYREAWMRCVRGAARWVEVGELCTVVPRYEFGAWPN